MEIEVKHEITSIEIETNYSEETPYRVLYFSGELCHCTELYFSLVDALHGIEEREWKNIILK